MHIAITYLYGSFSTILLFFIFWLTFFFSFLPHLTFSFHCLNWPLPLLSTIPFSHQLLILGTQCLSSTLLLFSSNIPSVTSFCKSQFAHLIWISNATILAQAIIIFVLGILHSLLMGLLESTQWYYIWMTSLNYRKINKKITNLVFPGLIHVVQSNWVLNTRKS